MRYIDLNSCGPLHLPPPETDLVELVVQRRRATEFPGFAHGLFLLAYMIWPGDAEVEQRNLWVQAHRIFGARFAVPLRLGADPAHLGMLATSKALREPRYRRLYERQALVQERDWPRVATLLETVVAIAHDEEVSVLPGHASLGKAADLLAHRDRQTGSKATRSGGTRTYLNAWAGFREAAHIIAAAHALAYCANDVLRLSDEAVFQLDMHDVVFTAPDAVLMVACAFENFGRCIVPHAQTEPLLGDQTWSVAAMPGLTTRVLPIPELTEEDKKFLIETRKARPKEWPMRKRSDDPTK